MTDQQTRSQTPLKPFYSHQDTIGLDYAADLNDPGAHPYTRGRRARLYHGGGWIQRELSGEGDPARSNEQLKYLIAQGQTGVDVIGDSPTMAMMDPDHPLAEQAIGTQGVSLCRLQDYRELFKDLPLDSISVSSSAPPFMSLSGMYLAGREAGVPSDRLRGSVLQPPFYAEDCGYAMKLPVDLRVRLALDAMEFAAREMPRFHSYVEDTYFFSEVGLTPVEEMALGFVEIRHLVRELIKRGVDVDAFAPRIAILVNCGMEIFEEIAKIRATRRLFARMMKEEFGAKDPRSLSVVITCHTSGLSLTAQQPFNNIVRGAVQTLALVMAGVQAIEISAFDEAYRTPSPESHLVGLRTQQVIFLETDAARVTDPLGGSYFVESLTNEIEARILDMIREIESKGNPADLADQGYFKKIFQDSMERYGRLIDSGEAKKVGVNVFQIPEEEDVLLKDVSERKIEPVRDRIEKIATFRKQRNNEAVLGVLRRVRDTAGAHDENLMPVLVEAMRAGATLGEMAGALRLAYDTPYDPYGFLSSPI